MILTEYVKYRNKDKKVIDLSTTSAFKVDVKCPVCQEIRNVHYRSVCSAGHFICLKCINKIRNSKILNKDERFGRLTVLGNSSKSGKSVCQCDCGKVLEIDNYRLRRGFTKSCGCLKKENFNNSIRITGEKHPNWKGGISDLREREMQTKKYKDWRKSVFERDNYTCQKCQQEGYELNAHHIFNYSKYKNKRLSEDNGITFCEDCHIEFHNLYGRDNDREQVCFYLGMVKMGKYI